MNYHKLYLALFLLCTAPAATLSIHAMQSTEPCVQKYANPLKSKPLHISSEQEIIDSFMEINASFKHRCKTKMLVFNYNLRGDGDIDILVKYAEKLPNELTQEEKNLFKYSDEKMQNFLPPTFTYQYTDRGLFSKPAPLTEDIQQTLPPPSIKPLHAPADAIPRLLSIQKCAELIKGKRVLFYTGAGISATSGIHTLSSLWQDLGCQCDQEVDQFVKTALTTPENLIEKIKAFYISARDGKPSKAHFALSKIAFNMHTNIMTGNFDRLHERAGIKPYRVFYNPVFKNLDDVACNIDAIVCIGMSHDFNNVLAYYKSLNPGGILISINNEKPSFIGPKDYFVQGDIQDLIPQLAEELFPEELF